MQPSKDDIALAFLERLSHRCDNNQIKSDIITVEVKSQRQDLIGHKVLKIKDNVPDLNFHVLTYNMKVGNDLGRSSASKATIFTERISK